MDRDPLNQPIVDAAPTVPVPAAATQPVATSRPDARRSGSGRLVNLALGGAVVLAIAGIAFAAGRVTAPAPVTTGAFPGGNGQFPLPSGGAFRGGNGGGLLGASGATVEGTVESISATTLTLKTASGQTIQIALAAGTTYHAQTDATANDVTTGTKLLVRVGGVGGPTASGTAGGLSASDVTVVP